MADRMAVLRSGRLLQCDTPHEIYEHPADRFVADFIGVMNFLDGKLAADGVDLAYGPRIVGAVPPGAMPEAPATAAVRPERIRLFPENTIANRLTGQVEAVVYHGLDLQLQHRDGAFRTAPSRASDGGRCRPAAGGTGRHRRGRLGAGRHAHLCRLIRGTGNRNHGRKDDRLLPRSRLWAGAEFGRHRPGRRGARPQGGVPLRSGLRPGLRGLRLRGPSGEPLGADAARADGEVLGGLHQRPHPELPEVALRPDRQLREGLLDGDRRHREVGPEGSARRARRSQARHGLRRQRHPVPGDQAVRQAVGPHHLLLGERDRGSRHPAASFRLRRESDHAGAPALSRPVQRR